MAGGEGLVNGVVGPGLDTTFHYYSATWVLNMGFIGYGKWCNHSVGLKGWNGAGRQKEAWAYVLGWDS